jgi:hypothetical protein
MEILLGFFGYMIVLTVFVSAGRFLKECDDTMSSQLSEDLLSKVK